MEGARSSEDVQLQHSGMGSESSLGGRQEHQPVSGLETGSAWMAVLSVQVLAASRVTTHISCIVELPVVHP